MRSPLPQLLGEDLTFARIAALGHHHVAAILGRRQGEQAAGVANQGHGAIGHFLRFLVGLGGIKNIAHGFEIHEPRAIQPDLLLGGENLDYALANALPRQPPALHGGHHGFDGGVGIGGHEQGVGARFERTHTASPVVKPLAMPPISSASVTTRP